MHLSRFCLLVLTAVCVLCAENVSCALWQFGELITCTQEVNPFIYNNYGCYCGFSGSGSPRDEIDHCCAVHDKCYENARKLPECFGFLNLPYFKVYHFSCSVKTITCSASNGKCQATVCECDRVAADCFALYRRTYNHNYKHLPKEECKK